MSNAAVSPDSSVRNVKVFFSSPTELGPERKHLRELIVRLNGEYETFVHFQPVLYEDDVYAAHKGGFQAQIEKSSDCDLVLGLFWGRLGKPLPETFPEKPLSGEPYQSGTAYELITAWEARERTGKGPEVYVFRKTADRIMPTDLKAIDEATNQWLRLNAFFAEHFDNPGRGILRAHETFADLLDLGRKVETVLRKWILENVRRSVVWPVETQGSPFRGLESFDAKHAKVYFGRDRKVNGALHELKSAAAQGRPFLLIPGASGSGKSSLMRAGIAPRLTRPGVVADVGSWRIAVMRPGAAESPTLSLCQSLFVTGAESDDLGGFGPALPELGRGAMRSPESLTGLLHDSVEFAVEAITAALDEVARTDAAQPGFVPPLPTKLLLLIDQFEEVFTDAATEEERARNLKARQRFIDVIQRLLDSNRVWVIATIRADMYERMITERPLIALKDRGGQFDLCPPGGDELEEIVHRSAEAAGLSFEEHEAPDEHGVVHVRRLADVILRDAAGENTLPLLQFALDQLFRRCWETKRSKVLTFAAYEALGGMNGAIERTAESALAALIVSGQLDGASPAAAGGRPGQTLPSEEESAAIDREINPILASLLRRLAAPVAPDGEDGENGGDRPLTAKSVPIAAIQAHDARTMRIIDALVSARVFTVHGAQLLRIAHDRVLTSWSRAEALVERNRTFYRVFEAVEHARREWFDHDKSPDFLLHEGAPVAQAEEILRDYGLELAPATADFIRRSSSRSKRRQRFAWMAASVFGDLAVFAAVIAIYAIIQRSEALAAESKAQAAAILATSEATRANNNYAAASTTMGELIKIISDRLRDKDGISVQTIQDSLTSMQLMLQQLSLQSFGDKRLDRISGDFHFEFASAFQNKKRDDPKIDPRARALEEAEAALGIRKRLTAHAATDVELQYALARSYDQVGDIRRDSAKGLLRVKPPDMNEVNKRYAAAQQSFEASLAIRQRLFAAFPTDKTRRVELSKSFVRLGDVKNEAAQDAEGALELYLQSFALAVQNLAADPDDVHGLREFAYTAQKIAGIRYVNTPRAGLFLQEWEVTARFLVHDRGPENTLWKRDLSWSLSRRCDFAVKAQRLECAEEAVLHVIVLREDLVESDRLQRLFANELSDGYFKAAGVAQVRQRPMIAVGLLHFALQERSGSGEEDKEIIEKINATLGENRAALMDQYRERVDSLDADCRSATVEYLKAARTRVKALQKSRLTSAQQRWRDFTTQLSAAAEAERVQLVFQFAADDDQRAERLREDRDRAERLRDQGTRKSLAEAIKIDRTVPLARLMLAQIIEREERDKPVEKRNHKLLARAAKERRNELDQLPDDPLWRARAIDLLRQSPDAMVGDERATKTCAEAAAELEARQGPHESPEKLPNG